MTQMLKRMGVGLLTAALSVVMVPGASAATIATHDATAKTSQVQKKKHHSKKKIARTSTKSSRNSVTSSRVTKRT